MDVGVVIPSGLVGEYDGWRPDDAWARALETATRMLGPGSAVGIDDDGVEAPVCAPAGLQHPRIRSVVGGNGRQVMWRLAARFADELNLDGPDPDQLPAWRRDRRPSSTDRHPRRTPCRPTASMTTASPRPAS